MIPEYPKSRADDEPRSAGDAPVEPDHQSNAVDGRELRWDALPEISIPLEDEPLDLGQTLDCGQAFRWREDRPGIWTGVVGRSAWQVRVDRDELRARVAPGLPETAARVLLTRYFALDLSARQIQERVARSHPLAAGAVAEFKGMRILRQDPLETILTFTIATATNVPRVTRSIAAICRRFGEPITVVDGVAYHAFPTLDGVLGAPLDELFGACNLAYRARSLKAVAASLRDRSGSWPADLARLPYSDAHRALEELPFLGPKVSDCICLFGLGHAEAVPVDVHVWAIAHELFGEAIPTRTLTRKTYQRIGDRFRATFGPWAGWAQQYLFCARRAIPINRRFRPRG